MILIKKKSRNEAGKKLFPKIPKEDFEKMPVFKCSCGAKILIVPDMSSMNKAIENHLVEHKKITGEDLNGEILVQEILIALSESWLL